MQAGLRTAAIDSLEKRIELMKNGDEEKGRRNARRVYFRNGSGTRAAPGNERT